MTHDPRLPGLGPRRRRRAPRRGRARGLWLVAWWSRRARGLCDLPERPGSSRSSPPATRPAPGPSRSSPGTPIAPDAPPVRCLGSLERDVTAHARRCRSRAERRAGRGLHPPRPRDVHALPDVLLPRAAAASRLLHRAGAPGGSSTRTRTTGSTRTSATRPRTPCCTWRSATCRSGSTRAWPSTSRAPTGGNGLNPEHVARLPDDLKAGWRPDLARLESLKSVREMTPRDYRESWAWVHFLLNEPGPGKADLLAYLADLRQSPGPARRACRSGWQRSTAARARSSWPTSSRCGPPRASPPRRRRDARAKQPTILLQNAARARSSRPRARRPAAEPLQERARLLRDGRPVVVSAVPRAPASSRSYRASARSAAR